jgi:hypothetical protein
VVCGIIINSKRKIIEYSGITACINDVVQKRYEDMFSHIMNWLNNLDTRVLGLFFSIGRPNMTEELRLVGGLKLEKNGRLKFLCIRAVIWDKNRDNAVRNVMSMFKNMGFRVKRMSQL